MNKKTIALSENVATQIADIVSKIDFDDVTERLFRDYVNYACNEEERSFLDIAINSVKKPIFKYPKNIDVLNVGYKNNYSHNYTKQKDSAQIQVWVRNKKLDGDVSIINDTDNFIKQIMNLIYVSGGKLLRTKRKQKYLILKAQDKKYYVKEGKYTDNLVWWYVHYNHLLYNKSAFKNKSKEKLKELIDKTSNGERLYNTLKEYFDNFDFIFGILSMIQTFEKRKAFLYYLEIDEGFSAKSSMNRILAYLSEANFLYEMKELPKKMSFIRQKEMHTMWIYKEDFQHEGPIRKDYTNILWCDSQRELRKALLDLTNDYEFIYKVVNDLMKTDEILKKTIEFVKTKMPAKEEILNFIAANENISKKSEF